MMVETVSSFVAMSIAAPVQATPAASPGTALSSYTGTSNPPSANAPQAYGGDIQATLQEQVNDLIQSERRMKKAELSDPSVTGVSSEAAPVVKGLSEAFKQVQTMFEFSIKSTLLGSIASQSVSAVTTLAKSQ